MPTEKDTLQKKQLSIIIVTYNSERDIYECLDSIFRYNDLPQEALEVIVVDNDSDSAQTMFNVIARQYGDRVTCINNKHNGGYGQGNNIGLRGATAPIAMIMNPDVRLVEPVFRVAVCEFHRKPHLSMYGMRQMAFADVPSNLSFDCTTMMNGYVGTILTAVCARLNLYLPRIMYLSGACFFVRRSMFEKVGYFDESIFMYGEEDDIHWRIGKKFGWHFAYNRHLHYIHKTDGRQPSVACEMRMIHSVTALNAKKGYSSCKTLLNRLRKYDLLVWREHLKITLGRGNRQLYRVLQETCESIRQMYVEAEHGSAIKE